jgi:hypothetical protein
MSMLLWRDVERGLTNTELDTNFIELAAGTVSQSLIDNTPTITPTIKINLGLYTDARLILNGSDYDFTIPEFNSSEGTFLIEHQIALSGNILSNSGTPFLISQGAGKIAISYNSTGTSTVYNSGTATSGTAIVLTSLIKIINGVGQTKFILKYYPKKLSDAVLQQITK